MRRSSLLRSDIPTDSVGIVHVVLFITALAFAGFFCSAETAFISLQKLRVRHLIRTGAFNAERVASILEHPEKFLSTVLLAINFFETAVAALGTVMAISLWGDNLGTAIATIAITILTLIFAEVIPKTLAAHYGERLALRYARLIEVSTLVLYPFVWVLSHIGLGFRRLGGETGEAKPTVSAEEMKTAITIGQQEGVLKDDQAELLHQVFHFSDKKVREILTPRTETIWIEEGTTLRAFLDAYSQHPHTRFPVFKDTTDHVIGILSIKDVLIALAARTCDIDSTIDALVRPAYFVPFSKHLGDLLSEMREHNHHVAVAVTEFGGVAGIATLEQVIEEIVGEIRDELSHKDVDFVALGENAFQVDGGLRLEDVNEKLRLDLPPGDYATVAGFVISHLGRIPNQGEQFRYRDLKFTISRMAGVRIEELMITRDKDAAPPA